MKKMMNKIIILVVLLLGTACSVDMNIVTENTTPSEEATPTPVVVVGENPRAEISGGAAVISGSHFKTQVNLNENRKAVSGSRFSSTVSISSGLIR